MRKLMKMMLGALLGLAFLALPALAAERTFRSNELDQVVEVSDSDNPAINATFTYDENGNRKTKTQGGVTTTYRWDARDRLIEVLRDGSWLAQYDYDSDGLRIEKVVRGSPNSTLTRFQYVDHRLQSEANALNNTLATYYRDSAGRLLGLRRNGEYRAVLSDGQGTPIALLSPEGAIVGRFAYDPWGGLLGSTGADSIPIRYTGYYYDDETGLYYAGARYYDPTIGAFISRDPVDGDVEFPITQNKYAAFNANPGKYQDPTGRCGLATGDTVECISNVAVAEGWSDERYQEELAIQSAAEDRSGPGKLLGMAGTMTGLGLARALGAGYQAFLQFRHFGYAAAVVANQGAPHVEQALELASGTPGPGISAVPSVAALESRTARMASATQELSDVPLPPAATQSIAPSYNGPLVVAEGPRLSPLLVPTKSGAANALTSVAAVRNLAHSEVDALRQAGLTDREISRRMQLGGDITIFRGTSVGWPGNRGLQITQTSPASLDPIVATVFALESRIHGGTPIVQLGTRTAFGQSIDLGNGDQVRRMFEREVSLGVDPSTFTTLAPRTISADQSRAVLGEMGYHLPSTIRDNNQATQLLEGLPRLTPEQVQTYLDKIDSR